jgi:hypothetical protein
MTALDLVATAIGWLQLDRLAGGKVHDLHSFSRNSGRVAKPSCTGCAAWLTGALSGSGWLKAVRDDLVHQTVNRALFGRVGEDTDDIREDRTRIPAHGNKRVDQVILDCRRWRIGRSGRSSRRFRTAGSRRADSERERSAHGWMDERSRINPSGSS